MAARQSMVIEQSSRTRANKNGSYKALILELGGHLTRKNISELKYLSDLPEGISERIDEGLALLTELQKHKIISEEKSGLQYLCDLLSSINRNDLVSKVELLMKTREINSVHSERDKAFPSKNPLPSCSTALPKAPVSKVLTKAVKPNLMPPSFYNKKTSPSVNSESIAVQHFGNVSPSENLAVCSETSSESVDVSSSGPVDETICYPMQIAQSQRSPDLYYWTRPSLKGICLIIGNETFDKEADQDDRTGSGKDVKSIKETFDNLGFSVRVHKDVRVVEKEEGEHNFLEIFSDCAKENHMDYCCIVVFILSHGCSEGIYGVDGGTVSMDEVQRPFKFCKSLLGKPKLFFCQFCRGEKEENLVVSDGNESSDIFPWKPVEATSRMQADPREADFFTCYATPPGYIAFRSEKLGSWFICGLCDVFQQRAHEDDIEKMAIQVAGAVNKAYTNKGQKQVVHRVSTLTKLFMLVGEEEGR